MRSGTELSQFLGNFPTYSSMSVFKIFRNCHWFNDLLNDFLNCTPVGLASDSVMGPTYSG